VWKVTALGALVLAAFGVEAGLTHEAARRPALRLVPVAKAQAPVHAAAAPGERGRLYVVERAGRIRVLAGGRLLAQPFLDIRPS
jgi:hypothetical protein